MNELKPLERPTSPLEGGVPPSGKVHWVEPKLVAEVEYREWTRAGVLRQPVFKALRSDMSPQDCRLDQSRTVQPPKAEARATPVPRAKKAMPRAEGQVAVPGGASPQELEALEAMPKAGAWEVAGRRVELTNLDKVIFPGNPERAEPRRTKRDLIRYYVTVAPALLPHLHDRGVTLHRFPNGIDKPGFWQKQAPEWMPEWIRTWRPGAPLSDEPRDYIVVEEVATLAWLGNHAAIDLHPWSSRISDPEHPTWALFDLDPGDSSFELARKVLRMVKEALDHLGLKGCPKVSGQRGLQVYVPIRPHYSYDEVRTFVRKVAEVIGRLLPKEIDFTWEVKRRRPGTLRIDYTQMAPNKTLAAPYSVRPRPEATVSMPIGWDELDDPELRSDRWTIASAPARLAAKGDLFAPLLSLEQELPAI
jgi:bifunctional non-homologous end joining protein LigD